MGRSTKLILCSLLLLLLCYPLFATCYTAYSNPTKSTVVSSSSEEDEVTNNGFFEYDEDGNPIISEDFEGEVPPEKPDGDIGEEPPDGYSGGEAGYTASTVNTIVYNIPSSSVILLAVEAILFGICFCYMTYTKFCKTDLKQVFTENKSIIYSFVMLSLCIGHAISFALIYLVQYLINLNY